MSKEVRQFIRRAKKDGWEIIKTLNGHFRMTKPGSDIVFVSSTPGDRRSLRNVERDMRRAEGNGR